MGAGSSRQQQWQCTSGEKNVDQVNASSYFTSTMKSVAFLISPSSICCFYCHARNSLIAYVKEFDNSLATLIETLETLLTIVYSREGNCLLLPSSSSPSSASAACTSITIGQSIRRARRKTKQYPVGTSKLYSLAFIYFPRMCYRLWRHVETFGL